MTICGWSKLPEEPWLVQDQSEHFQLVLRWHVYVRLQLSGCSPLGRASPLTFLHVNDPKTVQIERSCNCLVEVLQMSWCCFFLTVRNPFHSLAVICSAVSIPICQPLHAGAYWNQLSCFHILLNCALLSLSKAANTVTPLSVEIHMVCPTSYLMVLKNVCASYLMATISLLHLGWLATAVWGKRINVPNTGWSLTCSHFLLNVALWSLLYVSYLHHEQVTWV